MANAKQRAKKALAPALAPALALAPVLAPAIPQAVASAVAPAIAPAVVLALAFAPVEAPALGLAEVAALAEAPAPALAPAEFPAQGPQDLAPPQAPVGGRKSVIPSATARLNMSSSQKLRRGVEKRLALVNDAAWSPLVADVQKMKDALHGLRNLEGHDLDGMEELFADNLNGGADFFSIMKADIEEKNLRFVSKKLVVDNLLQELHDSKIDDLEAMKNTELLRYVIINN